MRTSAIIALLLTTVLAGCASEPAEVEDDDADFEDLDLQATEKTGIIRGVVVDATVTPLAGATVTLEGTERTTTSKEDGAFGFGDLEPGFYNILVDALGYDATRSQTTVEAGVETPPVVRIILQAAPSELPSVLPMKYDGRMECGITTPAYRVAVCSVPNTVTDILGLDPLIDDRFMVTYDVSPDVTWLQNEMIWDATSPAGDAMSFVVETETNVDEKEIENPFGESPVVSMANRTVLDGVGFLDYYQMRVFNYENPNTEPPVEICDVPFPITGPGCVKGLGATIQQDFQIFSHVFYNGMPQEGWQFSSGEDIDLQPL